MAGFTTLAEHSRLCLAFPAKVGPGVAMYSDARALHEVGIESTVPLLREALDQAGLEFDDIDYFIPHQTSARAIKRGMKEFAERMGVAPKHVVVTVDEFGNTSSTTHFVALWKYLREGRFAKEDRVMLLADRFGPRGGNRDLQGRSAGGAPWARSLRRPRPRPRSDRSMTPGALELADDAARTCLDRADRTAEELDLLINAGVYHDRILSEPAFASLIQEDIGANLAQRAPGAGHGTFSFDVYNGACGLLTGIHLVDGMLASGPSSSAWWS